MLGEIIAKVERFYLFHAKLFPINWEGESHSCGSLVQSYATAYGSQSFTINADLIRGVDFPTSHVQNIWDLPQWVPKATVCIQIDPMYSKAAPQPFRPNRVLMSKSSGVEIPEIPHSR